MLKTLQELLSDIVTCGWTASRPLPESGSAEEWITAGLRKGFEEFDFSIPLIVHEAEITYRRLSEVPRLTMRESSSLPVCKCIYERLPYPGRNGELERAFIEWSQADDHVLSFCRISEPHRDFVRLRYVKEDGMPVFYHPDFLASTARGIYLVEIRAQESLTHPDVQRRLKTAATWCDRINRLSSPRRSGLPWHYVLLVEGAFREWRDKGARLSELLAFARLRSWEGK